MIVKLADFEELTEESIDTYRKENPFLAEELEKYIFGFITEFELHLEVCVHNIRNSDFDDAYAELKAAFDTQSWGEALASLSKAYSGVSSDEKRQNADKFFIWLNNIFKDLEDAGYDLDEVRNKILDQFCLPNWCTSIWGVRLSPRPRKTYILRCHVTAPEIHYDESVKCYSTDHVAPDKWAEILRSSIQNGERICVLEGEQLILNKEVAAIFLDYAESRNVYLPQSIISEIKKHFRCIEYTDYIRSYGQARTIVDLFKDYHRSQPIKDSHDWDKAVALIGEVIGERSAIDDYVISQVNQHPELFKLQDSGFDVVSFANMVLDEQNLASNTYDGIMRTRSVAKLWYVIRVLLNTRNYKTDSDFQADLRKTLKKANELDADGKPLLADSSVFFELFTEKLIEDELWREIQIDGLKTSHYNPEIWDEFIFNRYIDKTVKMGLHKFLRRYYNPTCHKDSVFAINTTEIYGFPTIRMIDGQANFCMFNYHADVAYQLQEIYEWKIIKDIVLSSDEYAHVYLSEDDVFNENGELIKGLPVAFEFWNDLDSIEFHFPINESDNNLPIFIGNEGRLTYMTQDEKRCLLEILRMKHINNKSDSK